MKGIFGVLVMFTGTAMGAVHAICRFNQKLRCYGTLGETLHLELDPGDEITLNNNINLILKFAVSSVVVKDNCFSSERRTVSCSSEGDQLHFSWTLSGTRITHQLDDGTKTLQLEKENFSCRSHNSGECDIIRHCREEHGVSLCVGFGDHHLAVSVGRLSHLQQNQQQTEHSGM
ncbi:uncharacterized protein LOC118242403 isoform X3 [Electrophorus electricus]|uniref:uncharacterized protein LOC118242403 isoform X3 n=1 Tax=Electrophorus electricus TaxID=8005 RepID=UPI0015D08870|nr:uncharacterized protein LOC118242403 isoform X3 [Electrophorus electricus]